MKIRTLFLTIFSLICFSVSSQVDSFQQDIVNLLNVNGAEKQYSEAYDKIIVVIQTQFSGSKVPEAVWKGIMKGKKKDIEEGILFGGFAYRKYFSEENISKMTAFFKTDAGKQFVKDSTLLTPDQEKEVASFYKSSAGKKIKKTEKALALDMKKVVADWRKEIFVTTMTTLINKGYTPQR